MEMLLNHDSVLVILTILRQRWEFLVDHKFNIHLQEGTGHLICGDSYDKSLVELFTIVS